MISVLLIGCSNLLNLLLVRGVARRRELATRLALGASPIRLVRQLGAECLPIGLLGGLGGVALADAIIQVVRVVAANRIPRLAEVHLDAVVVCFALGLTALATLSFAVIPGLQARHLDIHESLKEGARGTGASRQTALRNALVVGEVALAFLLLSGAGLLLRSFQSVRALDVGFNPERVLCANLRFPQTASRTNAVLFYQELTRRLETLPGVEALPLWPIYGLRRRKNCGLFVAGRVTDLWEPSSVTLAVFVTQLAGAASVEACSNTKPVVSADGQETFTSVPERSTESAGRGNR